jgi:hypothetical protein
MSIDRELLRQPIEALRQLLDDNNIDIFDAPEHIKAQVRAQWRFDMASLGLDTADDAAVSGAVAGLAATIKALLTFTLPPEVVSQFVSLFDCIEPVLDEDVDAAVEMAVSGEGWSMPFDRWMEEGSPPDNVEAPLLNDEDAERVRDLARANGVDVPDGVPVRDMSKVAEAMASGQPDLHVRDDKTVPRPPPTPSGARRGPLPIGGPSFDRPGELEAVTTALRVAIISMDRTLETLGAIREQVNLRVEQLEDL